MNKSWTFRVLMHGVLIGLSGFMASEAAAQGLLHRFTRKNEHTIPTHPGALTVRDLAMLIDDLDKQLFGEGKIAVKSPDIYGQNRLTKHRQDFEDQMDMELDKFQLRLQSFQRRADAASLMSSSILRAGIGSTTTTTTVDGSENVQITPVPAPDLTKSDTAMLLSNSIFTNEEGGGGITATNLLTPASLTSYFGEQGLGASLSGFHDDGGIGLEPTIVLDQKKRYLDHLNQIRRLNEGDDLVDLPGYGLYLVRMPVSLLPGPDSRRGKGAVVTVNASHHLTQDVLPTAFSNVVILDTAYQLTDTLNNMLMYRDKLRPDPPSDGSDPAQPDRTRGSSLPGFDGGIDETRAAQAGVDPGASTPTGLTGLMSGIDETRAAQAGVDPGSSAPTGLTAPTEVPSVYGMTNLRVLVEYLERQRENLLPHDPSTFTTLFRDLKATHRYMLEQALRGDPLFQPDVFENIGSLALARDYGALRVHRENWLSSLRSSRNVAQGGANQEDSSLVIDILAYGLMVQSVLIDRQLKHDMRVVAMRSGLACDDVDLFFFHALNPTPEAREAFNIYVARKWPIHVFSFDPTVEQQNELDLYSIRTQLQLAFALGVATGQVDFENLTSYARLLERDLATIGLNRTAVGFGAGQTTFGWRFYPRIQTPPTESNPHRVINTLLFNGPPPNYDLKNRRIEPGTRECVAMIVMPNFIPGVRFTTTANWFDLAGMFADQQLDTVDMVDLSRKVQVARNGLPHVIDSHLYRPEELGRLDDRITQLEALLPMQTHYSQLPFEGDLSASEIFSSESAKLAPRLLAWYGEPPLQGVPSSIFILGTNFSVLDMHIIAGGVAIPHDYDLISRNVLRITIPPNAMTVEKGRKNVKAFDIHVATPNGISNHLLVDVGDDSSTTDITPPSGLKLATTTLTIRGTLEKVDAKFVPNMAVEPSNDLRIEVVPVVRNPPRTLSVSFTFPRNAAEGLFFPTVTVDANLDASLGRYVIRGNELKSLTDQLFAQFTQSGVWTPAGTTNELTSSRIVATGFRTNLQVQEQLKVSRAFTIPVTTSAIEPPETPVADASDASEAGDEATAAAKTVGREALTLPPLPSEMSLIGEGVIPAERPADRTDSFRDEGVSRASWLGRMIRRDR